MITILDILKTLVCISLWKRSVSNRRSPRRRRAKSVKAKLMFFGKNEFRWELGENELSLLNRQVRKYFLTCLFTLLSSFSPNSHLNWFFLKNINFALTDFARLLRGLRWFETKRFQSEIHTHVFRIFKIVIVLYKLFSMWEILILSRTCWEHGLKTRENRLWCILWVCLRWESGENTLLEVKLLFKVRWEFPWRY